ncbi:hypothetical protein BD770DRAFT_464201 [Pilaira anomala]|nr:hypothetical protein BD770DRAFT_464201 [Pilaira anomala]
MRFFYSRVLSGTILVNRMTGKTLLISTIEVYERFRAADIHHERFNMKKYMLPTNSIPPNDTRYKNLCLTTVKKFRWCKIAAGERNF